MTSGWILMVPGAVSQVAWPNFRKGCSGYPSIKELTGWFLRPGRHFVNQEVWVKTNIEGWKPTEKPIGSGISVERLSAVQLRSLTVDDYCNVVCNVSLFIDNKLWSGQIFPSQLVKSEGIFIIDDFFFLEYIAVYKSSQSDEPMNVILKL